MTGLYVTDAIRVHYEKKMGILTKWMVNSYLIIQAFLVFCIFMCSYFNHTSNILFKSIKLSSTEKPRCFHILKFISILLKAPNIQGMFVCQKSPAARIFVFLSFFFVSKQLYRQLLRTHTVRDTGFHLLFSSISHASTQE